jgi:hypothetical protein
MVCQSLNLGNEKWRVWKKSFFQVERIGKERLKSIHGTKGHHLKVVKIKGIFGQ